MCVSKVVMVSTMGVTKTIKPKRSDDKTMHDCSVHGEVGTCCRLWRLWSFQLWKDLSEGAEEIAIGRRLQSETAPVKE